MSNSMIIQPDDLEAIALVDAIDYKHPDLKTLIEHEKKLAATIAVVSEPTSADCHTEFHAVHSSGMRPLSVIDLLVLHATEGGTSRSIAAYFRLESSGGSTQMTVDDNACYRSLRDNEIPWGAPGANYHGLHIEQCGYAKWLATMWSNTHRKTLLRAAYKTAYHARKYEIAVRFLTADKLKTGERNGITTHAECTKAFGGTHTDPGTGWPRLLFMTMVRTFYTALWRVKPAI